MNRLRRMSLPALGWHLLIERGYWADWVAAALLIRINRRYLKHLPHVTRFYSATDATLAFPLDLDACFLPHDISWWYLFYVTPGIFLLAQARSLWAPRAWPLAAAVLDFHAAVLSLLETYALGSTFKHLLERSGKLRPNWIARVATGDMALIKDGRESFPSGHALYPAMASALLTLFFLGRTRVLATSRPGQFAVFFLSIAPALAAVGFAMDRVNCFDHDFVDVVAGGVVGAVCGCLTYFLNFNPPTHPTLAGRPKERVPPPEEDDGIEEVDGEGDDAERDAAMREQLLATAWTDGGGTDAALPHF
jgi:diacylglycerol diphosphate phosphatase/phosphatidate phosphatase